MEAVRRGGDRQELHERCASTRAPRPTARAATGAPADLLERIAGDPAFGLDARGARARPPRRAS